ncbi:MAG: hypothetical protein GC203_00110 [Phenylobacterium sp.]|uniref:hypothetical protein n=1 Tax=Phenylobacterium sp. TaxID=1871053 RepID=UPI0025E422A4|nr:hypothetical protein [Phenylobacterium sp.]MBI1196246.1 hypothetical protein [Phenylobacterium sp.]
MTLASEQPPAGGRRYGNFLSIGHRGKGVPYASDPSARADGGANHGFRNLKGDPSGLSQVPELVEDAPLRALVAAINRPQTGLFTIGCVSGRVAVDGRHRIRGYVEFAVNSGVFIEKASNYFPIFFQFERRLNAVGYQDPVQFRWELEGATFLEAGVSGFSMVVYIDTPACDAAEDAQMFWARALDVLGRFLSAIPIQPGQPIY